MENKYKYLIWVGTVFLVILCLYFLVATQKALDTATTSNTVTFSGQGKVLAKPDVAVVNVSILTEALTSKKAQDDATAKSKAVTEFLTKQNVEEKDIKTTGYNIYPQYTYPPYGRATINGYQVNHTIEVKIRDLTKVSSILDGVVTAGANQVNQLTFQVDDPDKLKAEARARAIAEAKVKAKELQKQLGIKLGRIVNFSENGNGEILPMYDYAYGRGGMGGGSSGPAVSTGENEISVNVSLTYQIK
jgi:uncharacterized protein YggE